jgi:hypothetical protein
MQLPVMRAAQRYGELVAYLLSKAAGLGEPQVVRIARLSAADKARLLGHEAQVFPVAQPPRLRQSEVALVELGPLLIVCALRFARPGGWICHS